MIVGVLCIIVEHLPHNENRKTVVVIRINVAVATELLRLLQMCKSKAKKADTVGSKV